MFTFCRQEIALIHFISHNLGPTFYSILVDYSADSRLICPNVPLSVAPLRAATGASSDGALRAPGTAPEAAAAHGARRGQGQEDRRQLQLCDGQVGPGRRRRQVREQRSVIYEGEKSNNLIDSSNHIAIAFSAD